MSWGVQVLIAQGVIAAAFMIAAGVWSEFRPLPPSSEPLRGPTHQDIVSGAGWE